VSVSVCANRATWTGACAKHASLTLDYVIRDGHAIYQGDIDLGPVEQLHQRGGAADLGNRWSHNVAWAPTDEPKRLRVPADKFVNDGPRLTSGTDEPGEVDPTGCRRRCRRTSHRVAGVAAHLHGGEHFAEPDRWRPPCRSPPWLCRSSAPTPAGRACRFALHEAFLALVCAIHAPRLRVSRTYPDWASNVMYEADRNRWRMRRHGECLVSRDGLAAEETLLLRHQRRCHLNERLEYTMPTVSNVILQIPDPVPDPVSVTVSWDMDFSPSEVGNRYQVSVVIYGRDAQGDEEPIPPGGSQLLYTFMFPRLFMLLPYKLVTASAQHMPGNTVQAQIARAKLNEDSKVTWMTGPNNTQFPMPHDDEVYALVTVTSVPARGVSATVTRMIV
jgi:hypothetical protein